MSDTTTFFTQISCFFWAFWAYVLRVSSSKHRSTTHSDDLEAGIPSDSVSRWAPGDLEAVKPSDSVNRRVPSKYNTASLVVSASCTIDKFVDINLNPDSKIKETIQMKAVSIVTHILPVKSNGVIDTDSRQFQPPIKHHKNVPVSFPGIPMDAQVHVVDNRSKHRGIQFSPSAVPKLPENHSKSKSRRHPDSISDLLDQFPTPPEHIPLRLPVINRDIVQLVLEKTCVAPAESCPSPTISEDSTVSSSILSTNPSTSASDDTANTSIPDIAQCVPCISAASKAPSPGIDAKEKNIARPTLVRNPETFVFPATNVRGLARSQSLFTNKPKALPKTYHDVVGSYRKADLQKGDISKERPVVAPLRIVKKNKNQPPVVPLVFPVTRRVGSGNWELAMDNVLQAFRDAGMEDQDFRDLFYGDSSFLSQSSVINASGDDRGDLDGHDEYDGDCEKRLEADFDSIESSADENLSMLIAPPSDVVAPKVEDLSSVSLSSGGAIAQRIIEVKENNKLDLPPLLRLCEYEDSYGTDDDDDDNHSQEDDQWSDRLELDDYVS